MAIAHDAVSNSGLGTTALGWTHTPTGTPRGVVVLVVQDVGSGDEVTSVTYGGTAMTRVAYLASVLGGEDGAVYAYFLGASVPTGSQAVAVNVDATGSNKGAAAFTVTASTDTEVDTFDSLDSASLDDPSITLSTSQECMVYAGLHSGQGVPTAVTAGAAYTQSHAGDDFGVALAEFERSTSPIAAGSVVVDFASVAADEVGMIALAIREVVAASGVPLGTLALLGVGR